MEPVTHFLTGACIGRAGLNRKTAYATMAAVLARREIGLVDNCNKVLAGNCLQQVLVQTVYR